MKKAILVCILILAIVLSLFACDTAEMVKNDSGADGLNSSGYASPAGPSDSGSESGTSAGPSDSGDNSGTSAGPYDGGGKSGTGTELAGDGRIRLDGYGLESYKSEVAIAGIDKSTDKPETEVTNGVRAGLLTACAYDDHEFIAYWHGLLTSNQEGDGVFAQYFRDFAFKAFEQITVTVEGMARIKVSLYQGDTLLGKAVTDNAGVAYLFAPKHMEDLVVVADVPDIDIVLKKSVENNAVTFTKEETGAGAPNRSDLIQVMFVIDTTGSMGDEINYLKEEIADVISRIKSETNAEVSLAVMVYRDEDGEYYTEEYLTKYSDFTTDVAAQQAFLKQQDAGGGGDYEEAVDIALNQAVGKQWAYNATKIIVHVADAPAHDDKVVSWNVAVESAAAQGIRIVSVAASGLSKKAEYFFRSQSLLTGGVYVWLTDDSGIGGSHIEGTVENRPKVEALNDCLVRVMSALHKCDGKITVFPDKEEADGENAANAEDIEDAAN